MYFNKSKSYKHFFLNLKRTGHKKWSQQKTNCVLKLMLSIQIYANRGKNVTFYHFSSHFKIS